MSSHKSQSFNPRRGRVALIVALSIAAGGGGLATARRVAIAHPSSALLITAPRDSSGDTVPVLGPLVFAQTGTKAATYVEQYADMSPPSGQTYRMKVENFAAPGDQLIDSAKISLGSTVVFAPSAFASRPALLSAPVTLGSSGTLTVTVGHGTGAYLRITILPVVHPEFTIYGPVQLTVPTGQTSLTFSDSFPVPAAAGATTTLAAQNGDSAGGHRLPTTTHASLTLNGATPYSVTSIPSGAAGGEVPITLLRGGAMNHFTVSLSQATAGATFSLRFAATDTTHPVIAITTPPANGFARTDSITVSGTVTDYVPSQVTVNGVQATMQPGGAWSAAKVALLNEGPDTLHVTAIDVAGNRTDSMRVVTRVTQAPVVTVSAPANASYTNRTPVTVTGTATGSAFAQPLTVTVNGTAVTPGAGGAFSTTASLTEGSNFVTVVATDAAGNATTLANKVTLATHLPTITITAPTNGSSTTNSSTSVTGTATGEVGLSSVTVNGSAVILGTGGAFNTTVSLALGSNAVTAVATDSAGNVATTTNTVTRTPSGPLPPGLPPDTALHAPSLSKRVNTSVLNATSFLYSGSNPVQTGVSTGTIQLTTAAVIRGRVLDEAGSPLPGVTASVLGHPEYGQMVTTTPAGQYTFALNGGASVVLVLTAPGRLPIERQVTVPWQDFAVLPDIMMIPVDPAVTPIDFTQPAPVARGSLMSDTDGTRRATLIFAQGTTATMIMADSSTRALAVPSVRATEYTVGKNGPARMPGVLPPTSAYTYAVALTADEAIAAGALGVNFSKPVSVYVENFLGIPRGISVPAASYDHGRGVWVPGPDGVVIQVVDTANGLAQIAVDSTGTIADSTKLGAYGFTTPELRQLATLYAPGQSLWRVQVTHFTDYDFNYGEDGSLNGDGGGGSPPPQNCECQSVQQGSIISAQAQTLSESIPLVGTQFSLNYGSDQATGYSAGRSITLPLFADSIPLGVQVVMVEILVAGQRIDTGLTPGPNLKYTFTWNGTDAFGRAVHGAVPLTYGTAYAFAGDRYTGGYYSPTAAAQTFGSGGAPVSLGFLRSYPPSSVVKRTTIVRDWDARGDGVGGWTLNVHHTYDPVGHELHRGDGTTVPASLLPSGVSMVTTGLYNVFALATTSNRTLYVGNSGTGGIQAVAPNGTITRVTALNDGSAPLASCGAAPTPAVGVALNFPLGMALAPNGTVYVADFSANCVFKIDPTTGLLSTAAGTGTAGFSGDGGLATAAKVTNPYDVAVGPGGDLFIADYGNARIRRVSPSGIISTYAGGGSAVADSVLATRSSIQQPKRLAIGPDGELFINKQDGIWRISRTGYLRAVTAPGGGPNCQNGNVALQCAPDDHGQSDGIAVDAAGNVYGVTGNDDGLVYEISKSTGLVTYVAGCHLVQPGCSFVPPSGNGTPPLRVSFGRTLAVMIQPDGTLYFGGSSAVRAVQGPLPGVAGQDIVVSSADGHEIYRFDFTGRHLATFDAATGLPMYQFTYDSTGALTSITDADSLVTTVRYTNGVATSIVGPYGHVTTLAVDSNGYLSRVTDPAGGFVQLTHRGDGLLTSLIDANGQPHSFAYDSVGRLISDRDPSGATQTLSRAADSGSTATVVSMDAAGLITTRNWFADPTGNQTQRIFDPRGLVTTATTFASDSSAVVTPDGTTVTTVLNPDPRFGMQSPVPTAVTITLPSGLAGHLLHSQNVTLADTGVLAIASSTDTVTLGGGTTTTAYDGTTGRLVVTTPANRTTIDSTDARGNIVSEALSGLAGVVATYDANGRPTAISSAGRAWTFNYNTQGDLASAADPLAQSTVFTRDPNGRVTAETMPGGHTVTFGYDPAGNILSVVPPGRPAYTFHYNSVGLVDQYLPPVLNGSTQPVQYTYNADRKVTSVIRPDSGVVSLGYDPAGRLQSVTFPGGSVGVQYGGGGEVSRVGRSGGDTLALAFDGQLLTRLTWSGPVVGHMALAYDSTLRVIRQTINDTLPVNFAFDPDGLLTSVGALSIQRDSAAGLITGTRLGSIATTETFNGHAEVVGRAAFFAGTPILQLSYGRDSLGRISQASETVQGVVTTWAYQYDSASQLRTILQNGAAFASYQYDSNFNRIQSTSVNGTLTLTYDVQDHLVSDGIHTYTYSSSGELRSRSGPDGTTTYAYDALGNLTSVTRPDSSVISYVVDGLSQRVGELVNGKMVKGWLYRGLRLMAELDSLGNASSYFVYGSQPTVPDYMITGGRAYRILTDAVGSVRLVVDSGSGAVVQRIDYDPFGRVLANTNPGFQPFGFAGGLYDDATGLVRFGARDYDPSVGRWTTPDPLRFGGGQTNQFVYVGNNPLKWTDASGLIFGLNTGECAAADAARYWAEKAVESGNSMYDIPGVIATLWTPGTSDLTFGLLSLADGLVDGGLRIEAGNWKQGGQYVAEKGEKVLHFHWGDAVGTGQGLMEKHLPYEFADWFKNVMGLIKRGRGGRIAANLAKLLGGAGGIASHLFLGPCGCEQ